MQTNTSSISKRGDYHPTSMSNLMLRTDGFKKVVKGLSYKRNSCNMIRSGHGVYTSMGKRTVVKQYDINKEPDVNNEQQQQKTNQFRRTKTADLLGRHKKTQNKQQQFLNAEKSQNQSFKRICEKLGL